MAASQSFHLKTDVLMLTTNLVKKDLGANSVYETGVALNGLSCFITPDLARDLANDILALVRLRINNITVLLIVKLWFL